MGQLGVAYPMARTAAITQQAPQAVHGSRSACAHMCLETARGVQVTGGSAPGSARPAGCPHMC